MDLDFAGKLQLGDAAQIFTQNFFFDLELVIVSRVLVVASAAVGEIRARRSAAVWRWLDDCDGAGAGEAGLFFRDGGFDFLSGKNEGDEDGFAAAVVFFTFIFIFICICGRGGGEAGESVAAVDELFDGEEQELILRHGLWDRNRWKVARSVPAFQEIKGFKHRGHRGSQRKTGDP
jgi:hypothetical protein